MSPAKYHWNRRHYHYDKREKNRPIPSYVDITEPAKERIEQVNHSLYNQVYYRRYLASRVIQNHIWSYHCDMNQQTAGNDYTGSSLLHSVEKVRLSILFFSYAKFVLLQQLMKTEFTCKTTIIASYFLRKFNVVEVNIIITQILFNFSHIYTSTICIYIKSEDYKWVLLFGSCSRLAML